jgi:hypothetical protein
MKNNGLWFYFIVRMCVSTSDIYGKLTVQYGDKYMCQKDIFEWIERFEGGQMSTVNDVNSGLPSTVTSVDIHH